MDQVIHQGFDIRKGQIWQCKSNKNKIKIKKITLERVRNYQVIKGWEAEVELLCSTDGMPFNPPVAYSIQLDTLITNFQHSILRHYHQCPTCYRLFDTDCPGRCDGDLCVFCESNCRFQQFLSAQQMENTFSF